jgi:hypothetical protein
MKVKGKCPRGRLRLRWEQQIKKAVTKKKGRTWEESWEEEEPWEDRDRQRCLVVR